MIRGECYYLEFSQTDSVCHTVFSALKGRTLNDNLNNSPSGQFLISFVVKKEIGQVWAAAMML